MGVVNVKHGEEEQPRRRRSPPSVEKVDFGNIFEMLSNAGLELPPKEVVQAQVEETVKGFENFFKPMNQEKSSSSSSSSSTSSSSIRHSALCDVCNKNIVGIR